MKMATKKPLKSILLYDPGEETLKWLKATLSDNVDLRLLEEVDDDFIESATVVVGGRVPRRVLEGAKRLEFLIVPWSGINIINIDEIRQFHPHIQVINSHGNALTVAEYALALLLSAAKKIVQSDRSMRRLDWSIRKEPSFPIVGRTITILGFGAIARRFVKLIQGFHCTINVIKRDPSTFPEKYRHLVHFVGGRDSLPTVLPHTDYLMVMMPLTPETEGYLGENELKMLKSSSIIVNIARGRIIEEKALYEALVNKRIAAAALDVWHVYPGSKSGKPVDHCPPASFPFWELDNVVMSPHRAHNCLDRMELHWKDVVDALNDIANGKTPRNVVDLSLGY